MARKFNPLRRAGALVRSHRAESSPRNPNWLSLKSQFWGQDIPELTRYRFARAECSLEHATLSRPSDAAFSGLTESWSYCGTKQSRRDIRRRLFRVSFYRSLDYDYWRFARVFNRRD